MWTEISVYGGRNHYKDNCQKNWWRYPRETFKMLGRIIPVHLLISYLWKICCFLADCYQRIVKCQLNLYVGWQHIPINFDSFYDFLNKSGQEWRRFLAKINVVTLGALIWQTGSLSKKDRCRRNIEAHYHVRRICKLVPECRVRCVLWLELITQLLASQIVKSLKRVCEHLPPLPCLALRYHRSDSL
jgi:hypothetical protein